MRHVWVMKEDEYTTAKVVGLETQVGTDHRISSIRMSLYFSQWVIDCESHNWSYT